MGAFGTIWRTFLRFFLHQGYLQQPLDLAIPTPRTYKLATVPRGLSHSQAKHVLRSIQRCLGPGAADGRPEVAPGRFAPAGHLLHADYARPVGCP
jgi:hypothetical protein